MAIVRLVHKLSDALNKVMEVVIVLMLAAMVVITGAQIICRVFFKSLVWSEELTRYLLIWSSMLGASCVYKHGGHISVTVLQDLFPDSVKKYLKLLVHLICIALFIAVVYYGVQYFGKQTKTYQLSPSLRWSMSYIYLGITVGMGVSVFHAIDAILQMLFVTNKEA